MNGFITFTRQGLEINLLILSKSFALSCYNIFLVGDLLFITLETFSELLLQLMDLLLLGYVVIPGQFILKSNYFYAVWQIRKFDFNF